MSAWIIYDKNGLAKCEARRLEYSGEFLGACSVSVNITSPTPIGFELGDWLEYRGERFELNYDPSVVKESSSDTYGEGFQYENIVFNSLADELTRCDFLDYVLNDNEIHYSSLPTFSFFADSIAKLAERIQANLDRIYTGDKKWTVEVHPEYVNTLNVNITASNNTVWDALGFVNSKFGANFIIRGRKITIGTTGLAVGQLFSYGKGNGLYKIERNAESNQKVITRLRAYGSTRNMPTDYYHNISGGNIPNNMAVKNLMLPSFPVQTNDPYIDSKNIEELGVREGTVFFDGSSELEEIYPTMEGMTAEDLEGADIVVNATGRLDEVLSAEQISDDGKFEDGASIPDFTISLKDVGFDLNDYLGTSSATISMKDGMCGGREFEIVKCEKEGNGYKLTCHRHYDDSLDLYFPYNSYQIKSGDKFVLLNIEMPDVYIKAASQRLLNAAKAYLAKNDYVRYSYTLSVDNIFMARQHDKSVANGGESIHDIIKEGDLMLFEDEDLGIEGSITIASLNIKENADESIIPEYEITLQDEKTVGTLDKIQNQISNLVANGTGGSSLNTEQIVSILKAEGAKHFLSKTKEDKAQKLIKFLGGLEVGESILDFANGKGTVITPNGLVQTDRMEVRGSAIFKEFIFNRIQAQEGDTSYSENGLVEECVLMEDGTYMLYLQKRWENDFTGFKEGDILYGDVNNLFSTGEYYTSWVRVLHVDTAANIITVIPYSDSQVPGGVNHAPETQMRLVRRGNAIDKTRQSYWYLSATDEKCFVWLEGVDKPIIEEYNYYVMIGRPKRLELFANLPIDYEHSYIFARGAIIEDLHRVNFEGKPIKQLNDRGFWSLDTAQSDHPYTTTNEIADTVWHYGCRWQCLLTGTTQEPKFSASDWAMVEGNPTFVIDVNSTNNYVFDMDVISKLNSAGQYDVFTTLIVTGTLYNQDVTEHILDADCSWTRDTGNVTEDNAWAIKRASAGKELALTVEDLGTNYNMIRSCTFKVTALLRDGQQFEMDTYEITF